MSSENTDGWNRRISDLIRTSGIGPDEDGDAVDGRGAALLRSALVLALAFRNHGAPVANRVFVGDPGRIYFEWLRAGSNLTIGVLGEGVAELLCYSHRHGFTEEMFRWGAPQAEEMAATIVPFAPRARYCRADLYHG